MGIAPVIINVWMGGQRDQTRFTFDIWSDFYANIVRKTVEMPLPNEQGNTRRLSGSLLIDDQKYITRPHDKSTAQRLALTRLFS